MGNTGDEACLKRSCRAFGRFCPRRALPCCRGSESTERAMVWTPSSRTHLPSIVRALRDADLLVSGGEAPSGCDRAVYGAVLHRDHAAGALMRVLWRYAQGLGAASRVSAGTWPGSLSRAAVLSLRDAESVAASPDRHWPARRAPCGGSAFALSPQDSLRPGASGIGGRGDVRPPPVGCGQDITPEHAECAKGQGGARRRRGVRGFPSLRRPGAGEASGGAHRRRHGDNLRHDPGRPWALAAPSWWWGMRLHSLIFAASAGCLRWPSVRPEGKGPVRARGHHPCASRRRLR